MCQHTTSNIIGPRLYIVLNITTLPFMNHIMPELVTFDISLLESFCFDNLDLLWNIWHRLFGQVLRKATLFKIFL